VASFCSKCGAELSPDAQSCGTCGTPLVAAVPVAVPAQPAAAPAKSGNSALKIILIILAVVIGLGILGMGAVGYFAWRVAHAVHLSTSGSGSDVTIHTPGGTISTNSGESFSAADLGTDIYPGAITGKGSMRMTLPTGSMVTGVFATGDSKDQVLAFYKSKFGSDASIYDSGDGTVLTLNKGEKETIVLTITKGTGDDAGKTQITIVHTTSNKE